MREISGNDLSFGIDLQDFIQQGVPTDATVALRQLLAPGHPGRRDAERLLGKSRGLPEGDPNLRAQVMRLRAHHGAREDSAAQRLYDPSPEPVLEAWGERDDRRPLENHRFVPRSEDISVPQSAAERAEARLDRDVTDGEW